jgi:hypothetical protein
MADCDLDWLYWESEFEITPLKIYTFQWHGSIYNQKVQKKIIDINRVAETIVLDDVLTGVKSPNGSRGKPTSNRIKKLLEAGQPDTVKCFGNSMHILIELPKQGEEESRNINVRLGTNGSLSVSGCKNRSEIQIVLDKMDEALETVSKDAFKMPKLPINSHIISVSMYNSGFKINYSGPGSESGCFIDNVKLFNILRDNYNITCTVEKTIPMGINFTVACPGPNGTNTNLMIAIFQTCKCIITGPVASLDQLDYAYKFVSNIFKKEFYYIKM